MASHGFHLALACLLSIGVADSYMFSSSALKSSPFRSTVSASANARGMFQAMRSELKMTAQPVDEAPLKVGVIGCGRIGLVHADTLSRCQTAQTVIISNPTVAKAEAAAKRFGIPEFCGTAEEVINHPEVEAVWLCSPSQFHADQIKACAAAGKHIFCEKPIATDLEQTIEAIKICRDANVQLFTALQRRFDPNFGRVLKGIRKGDIGNVVSIKLTSRDPAPPPLAYVEGGGGIFKDMAIHDLDMSRFLMGSEPVEIMASGSNTVDPTIAHLEAPECYDTASIIVRFANGREAIIDVCRKAVYGYDQRAEVLGDDGMLATENLFPSTARIFKKDFVGHADMPFDFFMSRYKEAYEQETLAFVNALNADKPVPCSGEDGLVALVMAMAAGKSAVEGRWVKFDEIMPGSGGSGADWVGQVISASGLDTSSKKALEYMIAKMDLNQGDTVEPSALKSVLSSLGRSVSDKEMTALMKAMDTDGDGKISYQEFVGFMCMDDMCDTPLR